MTPIIGIVFIYYSFIIYYKRKWLMPKVNVERGNLETKKGSGAKRLTNP